jgi:hypothetical protein
VRTGFLSVQFREVSLYTIYTLIIKQFNCKRTREHIAHLSHIGQLFKEFPYEYEFDPLLWTQAICPTWFSQTTSIKVGCRVMANALFRKFFDDCNARICDYLCSDVLVHKIHSPILQKDRHLKMYLCNGCLDFQRNYQLLICNLCILNATQSRI